MTLATIWSINFPTLYPETAHAFHRESDHFVGPFVEGHMSRASVVLALARLGGKGSWFILISAVS